MKTELKNKQQELCKMKLTTVTRRKLIISYRNTKKKDAKGIEGNQPESRTSELNLFDLPLAIQLQVRIHNDTIIGIY